jgi:hypothetical protein
MVIQDNIVRDAMGNIESAATNYSVNGTITARDLFRECGDPELHRAAQHREQLLHGDPCGPHHGQHEQPGEGQRAVQQQDPVEHLGSIQLQRTGCYTAFLHGFVQHGLFRQSVVQPSAPDQLCMEIWNCYQQGNVDFGTFTNNKICTIPYNELSIKNWNLGKRR